MKSDAVNIYAEGGLTPELLGEGLFQTKHQERPNHLDQSGLPVRVRT